MDSNLEGKQGGAGRPPCPNPRSASYIRRGGRGCATPLRLPPLDPPAHHLLLHLTLAAPLSPRRAAATTISTIAAPPLCPRAAAPCSSPSPLAWLGEALLVEIVIITTTPSCC